MRTLHASMQLGWTCATVAIPLVSILTVTLSRSASMSPRRHSFGLGKNASAIPTTLPAHLTTGRTVLGSTITVSPVALVRPFIVNLTVFIPDGVMRPYICGRPSSATAEIGSLCLGLPLTGLVEAASWPPVARTNTTSSPGCLASDLFPCLKAASFCEALGGVPMPSSLLPMPPPVHPEASIIRTDCVSNFQ